MTGIAYIIPAHKVFADIERRFGARPSLWSGGVSTQHTKVDCILFLEGTRPRSSLEQWHQRDEAPHTEVSTSFTFGPYSRPDQRIDTLTSPHSTLAFLVDQPNSILPPEPPMHYRHGCLDFDRSIMEIPELGDLDVPYLSAKMMDIFSSSFPVDQPNRMSRAKPPLYEYPRHRLGSNRSTKKLQELGDGDLTKYDLEFDAEMQDNPMLSELENMDNQGHTPLFVPVPRNPSLVASEPKWEIDLSRRRRPPKKSNYHGPSQLYDLIPQHTPRKRPCFCQSTATRTNDPDMTLPHWPLSFQPQREAVARNSSTTQSFGESLKGYPVDLDRP